MKKSWGNPIHNGLDLERIHVNAISRYNISKEFHFNLMEFSFFQLRVKCEFVKLVQHKLKLFMFLHVLGKNGDVIDVTNHKIIKVFIKNIFIEYWKMACIKCITVYSKWPIHTNLYTPHRSTLVKTLTWFNYSNNPKIKSKMCWFLMVNWFNPQ